MIYSLNNFNKMLILHLMIMLNLPVIKIIIKPGLDYFITGKSSQNTIGNSFAFLKDIFLSYCSVTKLLCFYKWLLVRPLKQAMKIKQHVFL